VHRSLTLGPLLGVLAACDGGGDGRPLDLPRLEWTWVEVPGAVCGDGSPTGLAVNPGPEGSTDVLVFLDGGGACWDELTCNGTGFTNPTASNGPYGAAEFEADQASRLEGSILDRYSVDRSPFGAATLVFIPYCTGDVHWGDAGAAYGWQHRGAKNLEADAAWLAAHLPAPEKLIVSGSSAGGFGSLLAHDRLRTLWPDARGYLIDDSGPPFVGSDITYALRSAWTASWRLDRTLAPFCPGCFDTQVPLVPQDLSQVLPALAQKYPDDRIALLSTRDDPVIAAFFGLLPADEFEEGLLELVDTRIAPLENARAFLVPETGHVLLEDFGRWEADGVTLPAWIGHMLHEDNWATLGRGEQEPPPAPLR